MQKTELSRYEQAERIWRLMAEESDGAVWRGSFDNVALRAVKIPPTNPRRMRAKQDLAVMGCLEVLDATGGRGSEYALLCEPTLERYEQTGGELTKRERVKLHHNRAVENFFAVAATKTTQTRTEILDRLATKTTAELRELVIPIEEDDHGGTAVLRLPCMAYEDDRFPHLRCSLERPEHLELERARVRTVTTGGKL